MNPIIIVLAFAIMLALTVILCIALYIYIVLLKRQISDICRQMDFIERHNSNKIISTDLRCKPIMHLVENLNRLINEKRQIKIIYDRNNINFKDTISGISHDIRTPLTSLDGHFQLLKDSIEHTSQNEKYIKIIDGRIKALHDMTEQLFTFVKLENPSYTLECERINLTQTLCDTLFAFYDQLTESEVEPEIKIPSEIITVNANQAAVKRVIQNIVKNALTHGEKGISAELTHSGEYAELRVSNPMAEDADIDVNRVFERFYKADASRKKGSTGLGLFISKQLVERMGGRISAELENGIFTVIIKLKRLAEQ